MQAHLSFFIVRNWVQMHLCFNTKLDEKATLLESGSWKGDDFLRRKTCIL